MSPEEISRLINESLALIDERQRRTIRDDVFRRFARERSARERPLSAQSLSGYRETQHLQPETAKRKTTAKQKSPFREGEIADARA